MSDLIALRGAEFNCVKHHFYAGIHVLELGGGNGFQASLLDSLGAKVQSIDVAVPLGQDKFFPVEIYDGLTIPFPDATFDVVFSSNVLEHVRDINAMMAEIRRVLKPEGVAIHILPTPAWRFWTSLTHYAYLIMRILGVRRPVGGGNLPSLGEKIQRSGLLATAKRILVAGPHGEYPSAISEMWYFSRRRWRGVFEQSGYCIEYMGPTGFFYTGYALVPSLSTKSRKTIAKIFGSSTYIYVLQKS